MAQAASEAKSAKTKSWAELVTVSRNVPNSVKAAAAFTQAKKELEAERRKRDDGEVEQVNLEADCQTTEEAADEELADDEQLLEEKLLEQLMQEGTERESGLSSAPPSL